MFFSLDGRSLLMCDPIKQNLLCFLVLVIIFNIITSTRNKQFYLITLLSLEDHVHVQCLVQLYSMYMYSVLYSCI